MWKKIHLQAKKQFHKIILSNVKNVNLLNVKNVNEVPLLLDKKYTYLLS